ncbi:MAG: nucleotide exchange factor GrpE, partial [Rhodospirillaceae bacterium]|nr:nucleotide exchange factor GrpE [Rhodospirillaceae bacterium]
MTNQENENENIDQPADDEAAAAGDAEMQAALDPESANPEIDPADEDDSNDHVDEDPIATLQAKVAELSDKHLRAVSEAENTRRIAARDRANDLKYKSMDLARDLLGVVDNMTMALASIPEETRAADANLNNLYIGIDMTMNELLGAFERNSIKPIDAMGKQFDHNLMEAISQVPNPDVADGTVVQVVRRGFMLQDRLLRPAQVVVSTGGPKEAPTDGTAPATEKGPENINENINENAYE